MPSRRRRRRFVPPTIREVLSGIDTTIVLLFVGYCLVSGWRARTAASRNIEEYFLAGRTLPGWKAGISMAATQFAADTPLLVVGLVATAGLFGLWRLWIYAVAFLLMGLVLGPAWRRARVLTDAELAETRYGTRLAPVLRAAKAVYFGTIFNCAVIAMVLFATARIGTPLLVWEAWLPPSAFSAVQQAIAATGLQIGAGDLLSIVAIVGITTIYSTTGGLRAVVATDVVQFAIAMVATLAFAIVLLDRAGGIATLPDTLGRLHGAAWTRQTLAFDPFSARGVDLVVVGVIGVQWLTQMNADGTGYLAQRTMACKSDGDARRAALVFVVAQILLRSLLWIPIALALLVVYPEVPSLAAREATYVRGVVELMPSGLRGLMVIGMLAALASTIDTHLNWGASYWTHDIYDRLVCRGLLRREPRPRELVWIARASNLAILALALVVLGEIDSIQSAWHVTLLLGAGMGVPLVLRWLWWRMSAAAELAAIACSTVLAPLLVATIDHEGARLLTVASVTSIVAIAVAWLGPRVPDPVTIAFFERVRPPGAWGPVARACGQDPRAPLQRLLRGLVAVGLTAAAVFCALVGLGTWWFAGTAPGGMPRWIWITGVIAASVLLSVAARRSIAAVARDDERV